MIQRWPSAASGRPTKSALIRTVHRRILKLDCPVSHSPVPGVLSLASYRGFIEASVVRGLTPATLWRMIQRWPSAASGRPTKSALIRTVHRRILKLDRPVSHSPVLGVLSLQSCRGLIEASVVRGLTPATLWRMIQRWSSAASGRPTNSALIRTVLTPATLWRMIQRWPSAASGRPTNSALIRTAGLTPATLWRVIQRWPSAASGRPATARLFAGGDVG
jgi:hypothetical protein